MSEKHVHSIRLALADRGQGWQPLAIALGGIVGVALLLVSPVFPHCIFKSIFGIPCPGCGTIRALQLLFAGNVVGSVLMNPVGIILCLFWALSVALYAKDLACGTRSFHRVMHHRLPLPAAVALGIFVAANWAWNIYKCL